MESMSLTMNMTADELPFSLIESEILPRIPAKSDIARCMCVCKQWKSFLSTHAFARMHLHHHRTFDDYKLLLLFDPQSPIPFRTIPLNNRVPYPNPNPNPNPNPVFILATLDGLVCLALRESNQLVIWNPLTGAYKKSSPGPSFCFSSKRALFAIGFYIDSSCDYKLVYVIAGDVFGAYIYSNRLDSWRPIGFLFPGNTPCVWSSATLCDQCLYFTVKAMKLNPECEMWIMCFDVKTETFRKIQFPPVPDGARDCCGSLVVLNGCVHLCVSYIATTYSKEGGLWRLNAGDDGWVKVAGFNDPGLSVRRQHICTEATADGNWLVVLDEENYIFRIVHVEDFTTRYQYVSSPSWEYRSSRMIYVETLVSPNP